MKINGVEERDVSALREIADDPTKVPPVKVVQVLARVLLAVIEPSKSGREKVEPKADE